MRTLSWFSCGAASAVASKLAVEKYRDTTVVVYCDTMRSEHPDNARFFREVQDWLGVQIQTIASEKYESVDEVFERTGYMAGIYGARCTTEMKKLPRFAFQEPDDIHVFGFTADETKRIVNFEANNPELRLDWVLRHTTKDMALGTLVKAGIQLPKMYGLGYKNNNCLGCVKATSARYWNQIRRDFPEVFERRSQQSRQLGVRLTRVRGKRVFLDELPEDYLAGRMENISCGPECGVPVTD